MLDQLHKIIKLLINWFFDSWPAYDSGIVSELEPMDGIQELEGKAK